ncbi:fluoride efflux transporter FluC [Paenibacillus anseongensis]|uniref:fluoride efflux transporter FluC n=1 Tax=Paenibacillus TaxID=44249 RepID=UPI0037C5A99F
MVAPYTFHVPRALRCANAAHKLRRQVPSYILRGKLGNCAARKPYGPSGPYLKKIGRFHKQHEVWPRGTYMSSRFPSSIPYGTLTINLLACFLLGILMKYPTFDNWKLLIGNGFMRAFTTVIPVEFY